MLSDLLIKGVSVIAPFQLTSGASIPPEAMMHFHPCFRFPPIFEKFSDVLENSLKNSKFSSAKISDDFFIHRPQISDFPAILPVLVHFRTFPPRFAKIYYFPPYFSKFRPLFSKNSTAFYIHYVYFPLL